MAKDLKTLFDEMEQKKKVCRKCTMNHGGFSGNMARLCSTHINVSFENDSETVSRPVDTQKVSLV